MVWILVQVFLNFIPNTEETSTHGLLEAQGFKEFPYHK